jgi:hypothetical protein
MLVVRHDIPVIFVRSLETYMVDTNDSTVEAAGFDWICITLAASRSVCRLSSTRLSGHLSLAAVSNRGHPI